jgi:hypothetical protein
MSLWARGVTVLGVGLALVVAQVADADGGAGGETVVARYDFGSAGQAVDAVTDVSGKGHPLRVVARGGGEVTVVNVEGRTGVRFPGVCEFDEACPRVVLETQNADGLDPGAGGLRFGATLRLLPQDTSKGSNVMQKGWSATGSQYKLQVDGYEGLPSCVLVGVDGPTIHIALSTRSVADGLWHKVECFRLREVLGIAVDGQNVAETRIPLNLRVNTVQPLRLGGKGPGPDNDQFFGELADAYVAIAVHS